MLNKRTHILLDSETFHLLQWLSKERRESVGKLVRHAVKKVYREEDMVIKRRKEVIEKILAEKPVNIAPYTSRELIEMGRRI